MSQKLQDALFKSLLGYHESALALLSDDEADPKNFQFAVTKAKIYLSIGRPEDAIRTLDELGIGGHDAAKDALSNEAAYQLWVTMQVMAKAFLMNGEPKSAKVCINECEKVRSKLESFVDQAEMKEFEICNKSLQNKVEMEMQNKEFVGDLNAYAFMKST